MAKVEKGANVKKKVSPTARKKRKSPLEMCKAIGRYFREVWSELRKVTWPTKKELTTYTIVVVAFLILMTGITFVMDFGLSNLFKLVIGV